MTRATNARTAGVTLLVYIAAGVSGMAGVRGALASVALGFVMCFSALLLGVTLYRLTCDADRDLAMFALTCRVGEGIIGGADTRVLVSAMFFAVGSTVFAYLFLRGRLIPRALAWIGVGASVLLVVGLPLQLGGLVSGTAAQVMWLPMLAFEVPLAIQLIVKGC